MYPQEVAGIIFVDATHPQEVEEQKAGKSPFGIGTINSWLKVIEKLSDEFKYSEDECILQTIEQIRHAGAFPNVPVAVVSSKKKMQFAPDKLFKSHQKYQQSLLQLSPNSKHYPCSESGHFPQITQPQRVISAISDILNETPTPR